MSIRTVNFQTLRDLQTERNQAQEDVRPDLSGMVQWAEWGIAKLRSGIQLNPNDLPERLHAILDMHFPHYEPNFQMTPLGVLQNLLHQEDAPDRADIILALRAINESIPGFSGKALNQFEEENSNRAVEDNIPALRMAVEHTLLLGFRQLNADQQRQVYGAVYTNAADDIRKEAFYGENHLLDNWDNFAMFTSESIIKFDDAEDEGLGAPQAIATIEHNSTITPLGVLQNLLHQKDASDRNAIILALKAVDDSIPGFSGKVLNQFEAENSNRAVEGNIPALRMAVEHTLLLGFRQLNADDQEDAYGAVYANAMVDDIQDACYGQHHLLDNWDHFIMFTPENVIKFEDVENEGLEAPQAIEATEHRVGHADWYTASHQEKISRLMQEHPEIVGSTGGIQGKNNSCFMDSTIFNMFALNTSFDFLLNPNSSLSKEGESVRVALNDVVTLLRPEKSQVPYVPAEVMAKFRKAMGSIPGQEALNQGINRSPDEFINPLFNTLNCPELIATDIVATNPTALQQKEYFIRENDTPRYFTEAFIFDERKILTTQDLVKAWIDTLSEHQRRMTNLCDKDDPPSSTEQVSHPESIENFVMFASTDNSYDYVLPKQEVSIDGNFFELHTICPRGTSHYPSLIYSNGEWYIHDSMTALNADDTAALTSVKKIEGAANFINRLLEANSLNAQQTIIAEAKTELKDYVRKGYEITQTLNRLLHDKTSPEYRQLVEKGDQIDQEKQRLENYIRIIKDSCVLFYKKKVGV